MDKGLIFFLAAEQCKFNSVLIVFIWTAINAGKGANVQKYDAARSTVLAYMGAWTEFVSCTNNFSAREKFLQE
jgi:hypothetical protein